MPTTRRRIAHGTTLPDEAWYCLAFGTGMNSYSNKALAEMWEQYGSAVTARWHQQFPDQGKPYYLHCYPKAVCGA